jgi:hypothetical protein
LSTAPQAFQAAKNNPAAQPDLTSRRQPKASGKGLRVIATHTTKTVFNSNQASSQSHPASRPGRSFSCTSSLAHAAAQRSF